MFEASSVYFQCVNERAAHVKIDHVSRRASTWIENNAGTKGEKCWLPTCFLRVMFLKAIIFRVVNPFPNYKFYTLPN